MPDATQGDPLALSGRVWFTARQAAEYLGLHEKTVRIAHLEGRLRGVRSAPRTPRSRGGFVRFRREWLDAFAAGESPDQIPTVRSA